jgi:vacuolar-type H+-ATPase subunit E/Vma4
MSYDPQCWELAQHFLPDGATVRLKNELAQAIQDAIEDWLTEERDRLKGVLQ